MQPYFFPYSGYFSLLKHTDKFILFDSVQFIRHGWIERNRVLKPDDGWQYVAANLVKGGSRALIRETRLNNNVDWKRKLLSQLEHYKKKSPFYKQTVEVVMESVSPEFEFVTDLNLNILKNVCNYLGIKYDIEVFSRLELEMEPVTSPDEWALNICKAMGGFDEYWNPPGGMEFFDRKKYLNAGLKIYFQKINLTPYPQRRTTFEPGLSIIDTMMFNSPEMINHFLDDYELL